jgi:predicted transglutaminase-like cysteine proteinase
MSEDMSEAQEKFLDEYDKRYERMRNTLLAIVFLILAALLGSWYLMGKSQGRMEANIEKINTSLSFVSRDYTPAWYMKGITDLYALSTKKIVMILAEDKQEEINKINEDLQTTVKIMQDQFIQMRGGMNDITRSATVKNESEK